MSAFSIASSTEKGQSVPSCLLFKQYRALENVLQGILINAEHFYDPSWQT